MTTRSFPLAAALATGVIAVAVSADAQGNGNGNGRPKHRNRRRPLRAPTTSAPTSNPSIRASGERFIVEHVDANH